MTTATGRERERLLYHQRVAAAHATDTEWSPTVWDGRSFYSSPQRPVRHVAVCIACSREVQPSNRQEWQKAVKTLCCGWCHGNLLIEEMDTSGQVRRGVMG